MNLAPDKAEALAARLRSFLAAQPRVRVVENEEVQLALDGQIGGCQIACEGGKVVAHFWAPGRSLVRRVVEARETKGALHLQALRFGQREPAPLRLESAALPPASRRGRREFRSRVLAAIAREWAGWRPSPLVGLELTSGLAREQGEQPLEFFLFRHRHSIAAAVASPPGRSQPVVDGALIALLLWADRLPAQCEGVPVSHMMLVLPEGQCGPTLARVPVLRDAERIAVYQLDDAAGHLRPLSPLTDGNLESVLRAAPAAARTLPAAAEGLWNQIRTLCPRATVTQGGDGVAFHLHGLTFARTARGPEAMIASFTFGLGQAAHAPGWAGEMRSRPLTPERMDDFRAFLLRLDRERGPDADAHGYLAQCQPEAWMEEQVRLELSAVAPRCDERCVYTQVPSMRREHREVMDVLTADRDGRLRILELKASEDIQFPLQALDYWRAVRRHQKTGDFARRGYFPGLALRPDPPLLTLVAPALRWHHCTGALLRWIAPEVEVERVGLNEDWRQRLRVVERFQHSVGMDGGPSDASFSFTRPLRRANR